jgi:hypothetical protein
MKEVYAAHDAESSQEGDSRIEISLSMEESIGQCTKGSINGK